jgi:uncharacterized coiled-coil DUF342 family protein
LSSSDIIAEELINQVKEANEAQTKINTKLCQLLERKFELSSELDQLLLKRVDPLKEDISQVEAEIEKIIVQIGIDKFESSHYTVKKEIRIAAKIVDPEKFIEFLNKYPDLKKAEIPFKLAELEKLVKSGVVPNVETDGVDTSTTFSKFSYRKRSIRE